MKKKVGIVTIHSAYNYGAFLQAKATELAVRKLGYDAEFIDYTNKEEEKQRKILVFSKRYSFLKNIRQFIRAIYVGIINKEFLNGKNNFKDCIDNLPKSKHFHSKEEMVNNINVDILLSGSDQIWNPHIYNGELDTVYFLDISDTIPKVSYASSIGACVINHSIGNTIGNLLNKFSYITVREEYAKKQLSPFVDQNIEVVIDPTLLIKKEEWLNLSNCESKFNLERKKFILVYTVTGYMGKEEFIKNIKDRLNMNVVLISLDKRQRQNVDTVLNNVTPYDFTYLIDNAFLVVTDSFHGTVFSVNMNTNFISIENTKNPYRVQDILSKLSLLEQIVKSPEDVKNVPLIIEYETVNKELNKLRNSSLNILKEALIKGEKDVKL